jgi:hypothetical protein
VKLDRYGLVLTEQGRVLTTRPAILDDGTGGKIVGWQDSDPAMSELRTCETSRVSRSQASARSPQLPPATTAIQVVSASSEPPTAPSAAVMAAPVAPEPVVDEDDWEWTIALAKARAAGEPTVAQAVGAVGSSPAVDLKAVMAMGIPNPGGLPDYSWVAAGTAVKPKPSDPSPGMPRSALPMTVIPVPTLPTVQGSAHTTRFVPVVRTMPPSVMSRASGMAAPEPAKAEPAKPAKIELPAAARAVELPSQKRGRTIPRR